MGTSPWFTLYTMQHVNAVLESVIDAENPVATDNATNNCT